MIFKEKYFFWCILLTDLVSLRLLPKILGNMSIVIVCLPGCDVMNFEINLIFLIKTFFLYDQKVESKI